LILNICNNDILKKNLTEANVLNKYIQRPQKIIGFTQT
jgi:hypothetical protein